jgi:hypothetical protein
MAKTITVSSSHFDFDWKQKTYSAMKSDLGKNFEFVHNIKIRYIRTGEISNWIYHGTHDIDGCMVWEYIPSNESIINFSDLDNAHMFIYNK